MKPTSKFANSTRRSLFAGTVLCASAVLLLGGCQAIRPVPAPPPAPCSPGNPKTVPGQSVPDRFVPVIRGDLVSKYQPCEVITNTTFTMGAEYDWVPDTNRGKVKLWLDATAITPSGKQLSGDEIFLNANAPVEFDLTWGKADPVGRTIVRTVDVTLRQDIEAGTQLRVRLRDPGEAGEWPGSTAAAGPVAVLDVVNNRQPDMQGAAGAAAATMSLAATRSALETSTAAEPQDKSVGILGQSVPDRFEVPSVTEVEQGRAIGFVYNVSNGDSNTPVREVRFEVFSRGSDPLFVSKDVSQVAKKVQPGPQVFIVNVDEKAKTGTHTVWATISPFDGLKTGGKFIVFTIKINAKSTPP